MDVNNHETETDMRVNMLANTDKLISSSKRWGYGNNNDDDDSIDELDTEVDNNENNENNNNEPTQHLSSEKQQSEIENESSYCSPKSKKTEQKHENVKMTEKELLLAKLDILRKLGELKQCGVHLTANYNLDSELDTMQYEYRLHHDIRSKQNSVQWMSHMMIGVLKGVEIVNDNYNPFDIKLGGLSDKISSDMQNYYAVLGDIYEKYNQPGKQMAPEMRLLLMISGAALSMQLSRALPNVMGMSNNNEDTLNALRKKAEQDSNKKTNEYIDAQHKQAAQRVADLKLIQEKELEIQRLKKMANDKKQTDALKLSSEEPPMSTKEIEKQRQMNYQREQSIMSNMLNQKRDLENEHRKLDDLMKELDSDNASEKSTKSSISLNPSLEKILNNKKVSIKKPVKENDSSSDFKPDDISLGSQDKKTKMFDASSMSFGSKTKGTKPNIGKGKK